MANQKVIPIRSNKPLKIVEIIEQHPNDQVLVWVQFDEEGDILQKLIPDAVHLTGKTKQQDRLDIMEYFRTGKIRVLISKPRLLGTGLNLQHCHVCVFSWSKDSFEEFYQAVGRLQRYGQKEKVKIYIPFTELEAPMLKNVQRKEHDFLSDSTYQEKLYIESLLEDLKEYSDSSLIVNDKHDRAFLSEVTTEDYRLIHGDCIEAMAKMPEDQFDMAVFSPPFADLYSYTDKNEDLGNSGNMDDSFEIHLTFFAYHLYRVMKPGCIVAFHVAPLAVLKSVKGHMAIRDFPSECRQVMENMGFIYDGKATIGKNPQAQAIRTKAHGLLFKTLKADSRKNRFAIPDYLMKFRKPGEAIAIENKWVSNDDWIRWASPIWDWVNESNTLSHQTKTEHDVKHICPLQLDVIEACIKLWSAPGELVLSPFMGIGSEGVMAIRLDRRFCGIELKEEYFNVAAANIAHEARTKGQQMSLFK